MMQIEPAAVSAYLNSLQAPVVHHGPWLIFGALFVECLPIAGFILPGLTLLVIAGFVASGQSPTYTLVTIVAAVGGVLAADTIAFVAGRFGLERWPGVQRLVARNADLRHELARQSWSVLVLYQFPPYSRMFAPLIMGAMATPWSRWWPIMVPGTALFVSVFFSLGFQAGRTGYALLGAANAASMASGLFLAALVLWAVCVWLRIRRSRSDRYSV